MLRFCPEFLFWIVVTFVCRIWPGACVVICFLCRIIFITLKICCTTIRNALSNMGLLPVGPFSAPNESAVLVLCLDTFLIASCVWFFHRLSKAESSSFALRKKINARVQRTNSCSSADETEDGELDPDVKAQREKERRQANNARERWELSCLVLWPIFLYVFQYCF